MIKVGVADYGLNVWYGGMYDYEERFRMLKEIGYEGIERMEVRTHSEAIEEMARAKKMGMGFGTCRVGSATDNIRFAAALGLKYVWTEGNPGDFNKFCRHVNYQTEAAAKYGVDVVLHNHLGSVETSEQVEAFLANCPDTGLLLDVGHLAAAGGDPIYFIENYFDRIKAVHVKDYVITDPDAAEWWQRLRFCELGAGEMGDLNKQILVLLQEKGYEGWIFVEHDTHLQDPAIDLKISREYMKACGI